MASEMRRAETPDDLKMYEDVDPYRAWQESEGVKVIVDYKFPDLNAVELGPWDRKGGHGAIINIPNRHLPNDAHLVEIKPGGKSEPEHHMYEEIMYVVSGRGATSVWLDEQHKSTFEWQGGSHINIPLNAWYQHFNGSGVEPARYISTTNAPPVMRQWRNIDFIFNNPFRFTDRFSGDDEDFFSGEGTLFERGGRGYSTIWQTNFVPNADTMLVWDYLARGASNIAAHFQLGKNVTKSHISEFPVGTYKKGHSHGPGAHVIILGGVGFSLVWWAGEEPVKIDWKKGSMIIVPAEDTFHQHFNTGAEPARYLALQKGDGGFGEGHAPKQIEYEDEDREIHVAFEAELASHGAPCRMKAFVPWCTGEVGPTSERDT